MHSLFELIVTSNDGVRASDNPSQSDRDDGQGGGAPDVLPTDDDLRNGHGRFEWTDELRDDLLDAYESSEPARRGYMRRLRDIWCQKHPNLQHFSEKILRNQAAYLRRSGYIRRPHYEEQDPDIDREIPEPTQEVLEEEPALDRARISEITVDGITRRSRKINVKSYIKPQELSRINNALADELPDDVDIATLNNAVFRVAAEVVPQGCDEEPRNAIRKNERRIQQIANKIQLARQEASRIQCVMDYITTGRAFSAKIKKIAAQLRQSHHTLNRLTLQTIKQHKVDRIRALGVVKQRLLKRMRAVSDNNTFSLRPSRLLEDPVPVVDNPPSTEQVERFWKGLYETRKPLKPDTPSLAHFQVYCNQFHQNQEPGTEITAGEVKKAVEGTKNFAAPGLDGINNFWWKKLTCTHRHLARTFNDWLYRGQPIPQWFVEGRTVLIPKKGDLSDPKNYRPITCLNSCYKIFTRILYSRMLDAVGPVLTDIVEQRGGKKGLSGCKENLLIDRCITQDAVQHKRNLSMAWIDYRKAYDTTSHELLLHLLQCLAIPPELATCIEHLMQLWRTKFSIRSGNNTITTEPITFQRGVFQGDTLSPLLFCISLLPLSVSLRRTRGYSCGLRK